MSDKKEDSMRKIFTETEPNSTAKYSVDSESINRLDIGASINYDDDLDFLNSLHYLKKKSAVKHADSISTSNFQLSKPFEEVFSDTENLLFPTLSNSSKLLFTPLEPEPNLSQRYDTTSFENLLPSFDTSQPEYIKRKLYSLNKKRAEGKTMFRFKLCKSVTEEIQKSEIVNGLSINLYGKYVPDCDSQTSNDKENQLGIDFSPKYQNGCKEFEKSYLKVDSINNKPIETDKRKKGVERGYPFRQNSNSYNDEGDGNYGLEGIKGFTSFDRSQNARYNGPTYRFGSPSQSTLTTSFNSWTECPRNSFRNVSSRVKNFVKKWLDSEENADSSQSENIIDNNLLATGKQPVDLGSEIFLSNYSSEYCKEYDPNFEVKFT